MRWCKQFKGAYSGEHGDGLVRSEWIEPILGERLTRALAQIKQLFDPERSDESRQDRAPDAHGRSLAVPLRARLRSADQLDTALDWSEWGGFAGAVEMCNNNGHCRKFDAGTMCPSFRATGDEQHLTRGRANTLRLALSGQLGPDALTSACDVRHAGAVRELQGLPARMSDRRRHGEDEDRIPASLHARRTA